MDGRHGNDKRPSRTPAAAGGLGAAGDNGERPRSSREYACTPIDQIDHIIHTPEEPATTICLHMYGLLGFGLLYSV